MRLLIVETTHDDDRRIAGVLNRQWRTDKMAEVPANSGRARLWAKSQVPQVDVKAFLTGIVEGSPEVQELRKAVQQMDGEIAGLEQRLRAQEEEVHRVSRMRDQWMNVANEMQIQLEVVCSISSQINDQTVQAVAQIREQARNSLAAAKQALARAGMAMPVANLQPSLAMDEAQIAERLGSTFGANARKEMPE